MTATADRFRISIRAADQDVDLTVAAHLPLRDLLPGMFEALTTETGADFAGREVRLSHPLAGPLDATRSLAQSGVRDGELLVLSDVPSRRQPPEFDACAAVAAAVRSVRGPATRPASTAAALVTGWSAVVAGAMLGWPVLAPQAPRHAIPAVGVGCAVLLSAWSFQRRGKDRAIVIGLSLGACGFTALAAWLAVPAGPAPANAALAMSACAVVALAAARICGLAAAALRSLCVGSASAAVLTLGAVLPWWPVTAVGPVLATGWLAALSAAPRLVTRSAGLSDSDSVDDDLAVRTLIAHRRLTAMVVTATCGAVLGCLITALATPRSPAAIGLLAAVAAMLVLRMRIHAEACRAVPLAIGAGVVSTTLLGTAVVGAPATVPWFCGVSAAIAVAGLRLAGTIWSPSPGMRRVASAAEFAVTAALVPLACWAIGLFGAARGLSIS